MSTPVIFQLAAADLADLKRLVSKGRVSVRTQNRARVLLLAHQGLLPEHVAAAALVSRATVYNVWARYHAHGLHVALHDRPRPGQPRKVTPRVAAAITQLASLLPSPRRGEHLEPTPAGRAPGRARPRPLGRNRAAGVKRSARSYSGLIVDFRCDGVDAQEARLVGRIISRCEPTMPEVMPEEVNPVEFGRIGWQVKKR